VAEAEDLGYHSAWTAEAYGSDALTPLAWLAAKTTRLMLGTAVLQIPARTPAATAMAAITLDHLCGGRLAIGLGVSGPQVSEGWHGVRYDYPLARTREYVEIVRSIIARRQPVEFHGEHFQLPTVGSTLGKPLMSTVHPLREDLPIYIGAEGPRNVGLAAEIGDGWHSFLFSPSADDQYRAALADGFARREGRPNAFEATAVVPVVVDDDVERAADGVRPRIALYVGGMGARGANFHYDVVSRMGFEAIAYRIREAYLHGDKKAAIAAVPTQLVEKLALVGSPSKIRDDLSAWRESVVTTLLVQGDVRAMRVMAELVL
jgi:F420-dependent oxidoreductase-like protein